MPRHKTRRQHCKSSEAQMSSLRPRQAGPQSVACFPAFTPEAGVSIVDFVENTFFPACERRLSGGGTKCYRDSWKCHIRQHVIGVRLEVFRPVDVQNLLNKEEK